MSSETTFFALEKAVSLHLAAIGGRGSGETSTDPINHRTVPTVNAACDEPSAVVGIAAIVPGHIVEEGAQGSVELGKILASSQTTMISYRGSVLIKFVRPSEI